jgi:hypothetical protein
VNVSVVRSESARSVEVGERRVATRGKGQHTGAAMRGKSSIVCAMRTLFSPHTHAVCGHRCSLTAYPVAWTSLCTERSTCNGHTSLAAAIITAWQQRGQRALTARAELLECNAQQHLCARTSSFWKLHSPGSPAHLSSQSLAAWAPAGTLLGGCPRASPY